MESRVENLERCLLEGRKERQTRLDEIKRLWKRRNGEYFRRRDRRDHARSRYVKEDSPRRRGGRELEVPVFDGEEDAYGWLIRLEKHFDVRRTPEEKKLTEAVTALRGGALKWWRWWDRRHPRASWLTFPAALLWRFKPEYRDVLPILDGDEEEEPKSEFENPKLLFIPAEEPEPESSKQKTNMQRNQVMEKLELVEEREEKNEEKMGGEGLIAAGKNNHSREKGIKPLHLNRGWKEREYELFHDHQLLRPTNVRDKSVGADWPSRMLGELNRVAHGCCVGGGVGGRIGGGLGSVSDGRYEGGGQDRVVAIMAGGERVLPSEPLEPSKPCPCLAAVKTVAVKVGKEVL